MTWLQWLFVSKSLNGSVLEVISNIIQDWLPVKDRTRFKIFLLGRALSVVLEQQLLRWAASCSMLSYINTRTQHLLTLHPIPLEQWIFELWLYLQFHLKQPLNGALCTMTMVLWKSLDQIRTVFLLTYVLFLLALLKLYFRMLRHVCCSTFEGSLKGAMQKPWYMHTRLNLFRRYYPPMATCWPPMATCWSLWTDLLKFDSGFSSILMCN